MEQMLAKIDSFHEEMKTNQAKMDTNQAEMKPTKKCWQRWKPREIQL
jgi:peptidoglycan hydrolase CwlO-like protein